METKPVVTFVGIAYKQIPILLYSVLAQTYPEWRLYLLHDGPILAAKETVDWIAAEKLDEVSNGRFRIELSKEHSGNRWGHPLRKMALEKIKSGEVFPETTHIVVTNCDNYHVPGFCERMLQPFINDPITVATYSQYFGHSYQDWRLIETQFMKGHIDCCCVMATKQAACRRGWFSMAEASDWEYVKSIYQFHKHRFHKVEGCLCIHN